MLFPPWDLIKKDWVKYLLLVHRETALELYAAANHLEGMESTP
jgi:hypothetical protein